MWVIAVSEVPPCQCLTPRRRPDDVTGFDVLPLATPFLDPAGTRGDDQRLPARVGMPGGPRARGEPEDFR